MTIVIDLASLLAFLQSVPVSGDPNGFDQLSMIYAGLSDVVVPGVVLSILAAGSIQYVFGATKWASKTVGSFFGR